MEEHASHSQTCPQIKTGTGVGAQPRPRTCIVLLTLLVTAATNHSEKISTFRLKQNLSVLLSLFHKDLPGFSVISDNSTSPLKAGGGWRQKCLPSKVLIVTLKLRAPAQSTPRHKNLLLLHRVLSSTKRINKSKTERILSTHERVSQLSSVLFGEQGMVSGGQNIYQSSFQSSRLCLFFSECTFQIKSKKQIF